MALNEFLKSRIEDAKKLVNLLGKEYDYVSVLGTYTKFKKISTNKNINDMQDLDKDAGFVIKLFKDEEAFEYSCNDIKDLDINELKQAINLSSLKAYLLYSSIFLSFVLLDILLSFIFWLADFLFL